MLEKSGLISRKCVRGEIKIIIQKDQLISFLSEYESSNIEIYKSKLNLLIENSG